MERYKRDAIKIAEDLEYSEKCIKEIIVAKNEREVMLALRNERLYGNN